MALAVTTLSSACAASDTSIAVASATGFAAGNIVRIDDEVMQIAKSYSSGTTIPVIRGVQGTRAVAHPVTANVLVGAASDYANSPAPQLNVQYPIAGRARTTASYSAAGAIALPTPGSDAVAILNGTTILAMTVAAPGKDNDGDILIIASNGAAAHTITFTGGLSGAGTSYDVLTVNATAPIAIAVIAINSLWTALVQVPMAGTVTALTGTIA